MNEARNLPIDCVFFHCHYRYYVPLRLPPVRNTISPSLYAFFLPFGDGYGLSSSEPHFSYIPFPIYRGILLCCFPVSSHIPWFSPIFPRLNSPLFSFQRPFLTIRQNSLNVTVCMIACTFYQGYFIHSLSTLYYYSAPSLATRLTDDYRDRTFTGKCGPASLDTQYEKSSRS